MHSSTLQRHHLPSHSGVSAGQVVPLGAQYLHGFPLLITSTKYAKSMSGTQENQCMRPCTCGLLHTERLIEPRSRSKKTSISGGQQRDVTALNPAASSDADAPVTAGCSATSLPSPDTSIAA